MKKLLALVMVVCMGALCLAPGQALAAEKSEIIYANLLSDGALDRIYVVNRFESDAGETVVDYGAYYEVSNLTDTTELELQSDSVRLTLPQGTLFYQGDPISAALPWSFDVEYRLDGAPVRAESLSGASGALEIEIAIGPGSEEYADFYEHYALTMTVTLDGETCRDLAAEGATMANSGTDRLLTYTMLPSPDERYLITANVTDFSMPDIQLNAVPLGMDVDIDTGEISDEISELQSGISQLDSGSQQVASGVAQLQSGTLTLAEGADVLVTGAQDFATGLTDASTASAQLAAASSQLMAGLGAETGGSSLSLAQAWSCCEQLLAAVSALETVADGMDADFGDVTAAANAYLEAAGQSATAISQLEFSDSDIALLTELLERSSQSADVTEYLSAEIAALRRVLDNAAGIDGQLATLRSYAQADCASAAALAAQLESLASGVTATRTELAGVRGSLEAMLTLLDSLEQSGASEDASVSDALAAVLSQLDAGIQSLATGMGELQTSFALLSAGISSVDAGVDSLAGGADTVLTGANSLSSGAGQLDSSTSDMDTQLQEGVDDAISSLTGGEYAPVSYMDARNSVQLVQFVIRIPGVAEAEPQETVEEAEPEESLFDKFIDLFR